MALHLLNTESMVRSCLAATGSVAIPRSVLRCRMTSWNGSGKRGRLSPDVRV